MKSKHISRDFSAHRKNVIRPINEFVKLEIFSFDPKFTKIYTRENDNLEATSNATKTSWKSWISYKSADGQNPMVFDLKYNCLEEGEYRVDLVFEQSNHIFSTGNTSDDLLGYLKYTQDDKVVLDEDALFDGENNVIKRLVHFNQFNVGVVNLHIEVPFNCYFMGVIVRKVLTFVGDNYYGDALGSEEGNLVLTSVSFNNSDMVKPNELQAEIFYDDDLECEGSPSGFYIDYHDEVNFYVKDNDNEVRRVFGGYISSILPDSDKTKLTLACADRLVDGQNKYILDQMVLQQGTKTQTEDEYSDSMTKNFDNYPQALKYLCDIHEVTLQSNITKDYTVDNEKFSEGVSITYGKNNKITSIPVTNGYTLPQNNYIHIRNFADSTNEQVFELYDASKVAKVPPSITNYGWMHIIYGMGDPKTEIKSKLTETVDNSETSAGTQSWSKCGVSSDGNYIMAIGKPSAPKDTKSGWTKQIFNRKCPHCGSKELYWGIFWAGNESSNWGRFECTGRSEGGSAEGHIFCKSCDADYSVQGHEHITRGAKSLTSSSSAVSSSKEEAYKLKNGNMSAVPSTNVQVTSDDVFTAITKEAFKYQYKLNGSSSYSQMKKTGKGDCWAFSDLIFTHLKKYNVTCKIVDYKTNASNHHRSVLYKDKNNQWQDFPYREYGWGSQFNNMLNNTSASKTASYVNQYNGSTIDKVQASTSNTSTQTTQVTTTKGYDISKPFQAYFKITYSLEQDFSAEKYNVYVKFTYSATDQFSMNDIGFTPYFINNTVKEAVIKESLIDFLTTTRHGEGKQYYLQSIQFVAPAIEVTEDSKDTDWYKQDNSTVDESSCKMNLFQIIFDDNRSAQPSELNSCGKSVNNMMDELVKSSGYYVDFNYGLHRKDDRINFRVINQSNESFTASEGDNNNILSWNSISYSPVSSLYNMSMQVFKTNDGTYQYVDSRKGESIMQYGEQCTLQTSNNIITTKEAYFNAINNDKYDDEQQYTYTITVPNYPNLRIGDLVRIVANARKLNDVKEVKSIKIEFKNDKIPRIQTTIGLDEVDPNFQMRANIRKLRQNAKKESTSFSSTATPVTDEIYYEWDR